MPNGTHDPLAGLRRKLDHAIAELRNAIAYREAARPAWEDQRVADRLNYSFAAKTALDLRAAAEQQMLISLAKLWDKRAEVLNIKRILDEYCRLHSISSVGGRARIQNASLLKRMRFKAAADKLCDRAHRHFFSLEKWRHEYLAHRNVMYDVNKIEREPIHLHDVGCLFRISAAIVSSLSCRLGMTVEPSFRWLQRADRQNADAFWTIIISSQRGPLE